MGATTKWGLVAGGVGAAILGLTVWLGARPTQIEGGAAPLAWPACHPEQVEVLILGTFHFAQQDELDVAGPGMQAQISAVVEGLERFSPDRVAVEEAYAQDGALNARYRAYLEQPDEAPRSTNETDQLGFRLARRLGHERVYGVDVPMDLWHDSIAAFDERYPGARERLRARWNLLYEGSRAPKGGASLAEILAAGNTDLPPANSEMYARFLPLVEDDVYAGALKLRPWYDRNLRIVQNFFRVLEEDDERLFMVVGWGHLRILKQILEMTPQLCPVDPRPFLPTAGGDEPPPS